MCNHNGLTIGGSHNTTLQKNYQVFCDQFLLDYIHAFISLGDVALWRMFSKRK
jgi:thiamine transporter ThiT